MKKDANIGLFNDCFPPVMDGVSVCVQNYAYWLQKKVGGVSVITPNVPGTDYSVYDYKVIDYMSVPVPFRPPYVTGVAELDPFFVSDILKTRFKIVHAHCPFATGLAALRVANVQHIPIVGTFHSKYRDDFSRVIKSKRHVNTIIKNIIAFYEKCDEVWVPQESVKEVIREYGFKGNVEVVDNGCDLVADYPEEYFADARKKLGIAPEEFVMLFVGQHIWEKNIRFILDGLDKVKDVPFKMYFVGNGYAANEIRHIISENGLEDKVTMVGSITDRQTMKLYYAAADLFLFPSLYDNAPLVVREAAALHTPSLMIEGTTASSILTDGRNGFLVENSVDDFAGRIRQLAADPQLVRSAGIGASGSIVRSWEDVVGEVLDRYNSLIRRKSEIRSM
ncbi:MAG: glycosyltransferase [Bacteroidales bacterium]|nr:glycosyltransferase [Bacteroidales bacterium]